MKNRKLFALVLALTLVLSLFAGCSSGSKDMAYDAPAADAPAADAPTAAPMEGAESAVLTDSSQNGTSVLPTDRKLITTVEITAETEDMETLLTSINNKVSSLGGYMESQEVYNGSAYASYRERNANLTIRIPAQNLNQFVTLVSDNCNIVSKFEESEDVTMTYVSIESRIAALEVEQERLLDLLSKADNMKDLLTIESRLTEVRYDLEQITSQLRVMDNQVNYSTIHLYLSEVKEYTEVVEEPETFGERVGNGFMESLKNLWSGILELVIFLVTRLPYLIVIGAIAVVVILIVKKSRKKTRQYQKQPPKPIQTDDPK